MSVEQRFHASFQIPPRALGEREGFPRRTVRMALYTQLLILDVICLLAGPYLATMALQATGRYGDDFSAPIAVLLVYLLIAVARGGYSLETISSAIASVRSAILAFGTAVLLVLMVAFFLKSGAEISRLNFGTGIVIGAVLLVAGRALFPRQARRLTSGQLVTELILVYGKALSIPQQRAVVLDAEAVGLHPDLSDPVMLSHFGALVENFDRVLIDSRPEFHRAWALLLKGANINGELIVEQANEIGAIAMSNFHGRDTLLVSRQPLSLHKRLQKRALDLAISIPMLLLLALPLTAVAIAIKLDSSGPVFFRQLRVGRGNRMFHVFKFRSMRTEQCDARGTQSTSRDDDRITRVGRFIRATSIDELPQLINVLFGDMSLVGPRPHALGSQADNKLFWQIDETYWLRHQLKPGITGLAQVRGLRGATMKVADLTDRLQSDMEYIQGWTIWQDIAILLSTLKVLKHHNAF